MSHAHVRKETDCLNCGITVVGDYCHYCGQQNVEPKQSAWHLVVHFFNDVTHFDGKFFTSIKYLLTKPGFLTGEYVKGRRAAYLDPIRMYLFISAVYFLLLMSVFKSPVGTLANDRASAGTSTVQRQDNKIVFSGNTGDRVVVNDRGYASVHEYDSVQKSLPAGKKDGYINRYFSRKIVAINERYKGNKESIWPMIKANYFHSLPYMLFISLPVIALLFQLFYIRRRNQFYYVSHGIFTIHIYCFVFLVLILINTFQLFGDWARLVRVALILWSMGYLYMAMKRYYRQGHIKTFIKFVMIFFLGSSLIGFLALIFLAKSFLNLA